MGCMIHGALTVPVEDEEKPALRLLKTAPRFYPGLLPNCY